MPDDTGPVLITSSAAATTGHAGSGSPTDPDALVLAHLPLVGHCVGEVMSRVPAHVDRDDLAGAGVEGLVQASRSWRPETGVPFSAHARTRIRGAIVDELRAADWASRGARSRARHAQQTTEHLTAALGRTPSTDELADAMGVAADHVHRVRAETHRAYLSSLDEAREAGDTVHDTVADPSRSPEEHVVAAEHVGALLRAVDLLPERVREAVRGHYLDEEPMADIAARLGVTESRVSQLRAEGIAMLRAVMAAQAEPVEVAHATARTQAYVAAVAASADVRASVRLGAGVLTGLAPVGATALPRQRQAPLTSRLSAIG
ncbi:sigma-70 family RNA polymerase sigma factor [Aquipuribacter sp. SD81]|uniref:sigma-70 family RNA polymerase sigma factor n=1 Tax=Aquipuribacter sp. SD81 TaxID=3127703 RepID=UPI003016E727